MKINKIILQRLKPKLYFIILCLGLIFSLGYFLPKTVFADVKPGAPKDVKATAGDGQATVSFSPTTTGETDIKSYTVTSNPGDITAKGESSPITVKGLTNGTSYTFTVVATNDGGDSPKSSPSAAVTPATAGSKNSVSGPFQGGGPTQTSGLAIVMSIIIGILAITVPWSIVSEVAAPIKAGAQKALGYGRKGLKYTGAETAMKTGLYKAKDTKAGKAVAKTYNRLFGEGARVEEALKKQTGDIQGEVNYDIYLRALAKAGGKDSDIKSSYIRTLGKIYGGKNLEKIGELAAGSTPEGLERQFNDAGGLDMIKGLAEGDENLIKSAIQKGKAGDISSSIGALSRQLSDPTKREAAMDKLKNIATQTGVTVDQLLTMDLRNFQLGDAVTRPGAPAADAREFQDELKNLTKKSKTTDQLDATDLAALSHIKTEQRIGTDARIQTESQNAGILSDQLSAMIEEIANSRGIDHGQAASFVHSQMAAIRQMADEGRTQEAVAQARQLRLPVWEGMTKDDVGQLAGRTTTFTTAYDQRYQQARQAGASTDQAHSSAIAQAKTHAENYAESETKQKEHLRIASRIAGTQLDQTALTTIMQGGTAAGLDARRAGFVRNAIGQL